ncbi:MAG: hypothetical protein J1E64_05090 [Acetatifactor sp.]|nr:hypothetical protein [Acetatifactor sp.]
MKITSTLISGILLDCMKEYAIDNILSIVSSALNSKRNNIEEQFIYCIDKSLERFSQKYHFEYDNSCFEQFFVKISQQNDLLSEETLINILKTSVYLKFDKKELIEWLDLIDRVISEEELTILRDYILMKSREHRYLTHAVYPRILTAKPPLPPEEYLDREESRIILDKLRETKKLVLVNGIGGIGKSTVCRRVFHEINNGANDRSLAWVVYNGKNLLDDIKNQLFYPKDGPDWEKRFTIFIEQDIEKDAIIFIDNLNVTEEEEEYLSHLANARCNIVCTSRIEKYSHYEVVPIDYLSEEQCIELFYKYYQREYDEARIRNIVARSGKHTLVLEILGKIGAAENFSLKELENHLIQEGFDLQGIASVENKEDTLIGHLCRTFSLTKLNDVQKRILYCMAILPVQWIPFELKRWLKLQNNYNINYLIKYAWIENSENGYYMHPVIKEVVKRSLDIPNDGILQLLGEIEKEITYKENPDIEKSKLYISFAETILDFLSGVKSPVISQAAYNISMLYGQFGELAAARKYVDLAIELEEEQNNSEVLLASAYNHRGYINYYDFNDKEAEADYLKAYRLRKKLKNQKHIAETTGNLALLYQGMWTELKEEDKQKRSNLLLSAQKYEKKSIQMFEHIFSGTLHPNLASAYNNMAVICYSLKKTEMAIYYYRKAERIRTQLITVIFPDDLSVTYLGLCDSYIQMAEQTNKLSMQLLLYKIALINLNKGLKIRVEEIQKGNQKLDINKMLETQQTLQDKIESLLQANMKTR